MCLTTTPLYQKQIDQINKILWNNATPHHYEFIDNVNIEEWHFWSGDNLYLNEKGIILLPNNYLKAVNNRSLYGEFY